MKRHVVKLLILMCGPLLLSTAAWSQVPQDGRELDQRLSVSFERTDVSAVLKFLAQARGYEPVIDPALNEKVSFRLEHVTLRMALDALCDSVRCRWRLEGKKMVFDALEPDPSRAAPGDETEPLAPLRRIVPPGTHFNDVPFSTALRTLAKIAGPDVDLEVERVDSSKRVSGDVGSKTVQAAIRQLVAATGLTKGSPYTIVFNRPAKRLKVVSILTDKEPD